MTIFQNMLQKGKKLLRTKKSERLNVFKFVRKT